MDPDRTGEGIYILRAGSPDGGYYKRFIVSSKFPNLKTISYPFNGNAEI